METENVNSDGKARMIWKRYAWVCRLLQPDKNTKGDKVHWSVHYSLIDFPSQFLSVHWFLLLTESCSSAARSLHFPFAHFLCLLGTPAHVRVTSTNLNCLMSTEWYTFAQWVMRLRVGGSGSHCVKFSQSILTDSIELCIHFVFFFLLLLFLYIRFKDMLCIWSPRTISNIPEV